MNGWSVKAEYLYVDLGRTSTTSTNLTAFAPATAFPTNVVTHAVDLAFEHRARWLATSKF